MSEAAASYSAAQLRASLWANQGARVHAVIDGRVVPDLPARLKTAQCVGWDCLQRGALDASAANAAAYIVELAERSPFTDWLLGEVTAAFNGWGLLMLSHLPLLAMREHARDLGEVLGPDGRRRPWRWWDPELLELLMPSLCAAQQDSVLLPGQSLVLAHENRWVWWQVQDGRLARDERLMLDA